MHGYINLEIQPHSSKIFCQVENFRTKLTARFPNENAGKNSKTHNFLGPDLVSGFISKLAVSFRDSNLLTTEKTHKKKPPMSRQNTG